MTRLEDALIKQLAETKAPHAYSHEVKAMALEILERRTAEEKLTATQPIPHPGLGGIPYP